MAITDITPIRDITPQDLLDSLRAYSGMGTAAPALEVFRTAAAQGIAGTVDEKLGIIYGAKVIQAGQLNDDRPWIVDAQTLQQVADMGSTTQRGLKARFTHPSMSDDGLGHFLGWWTNFRVAGDSVRADLQLAASAKSSPRGDLWSYVLQLAVEDPEAFGVSVATVLAAEMFDEDPELDPDSGLQPLRFADLRAADVVDEPAATRGGLFSANTEDPRDLPDIVGRLLFQHFGPDPDPEVVMGRFRGLLSRYCGRKGKTMPKENSTIDAAKLQDYVDRFGSEDGLKWLLADRSLEDCYADALSAEKEAGATALASLKDDHEDALDQMKESHAAQLQALKDDLAEVTAERDEALAKLAAAELGEEDELDAGDGNPAKGAGFAGRIRFADSRN